MANPIATYLEVTSRGKRSFELHLDRVVVRGRLAFEFESTVRLGDLRPEPNKIWLRDRAVRVAPFFLVLSVMLLFLAAVVHLPDWLGTGMVASGIGSLVAAIALWTKFGSKIEYAQFPSHAGLILLDVGRSGSDRIQFDEFVESLIESIRAAQTK